ncbi:MAG: hypothetical protein HQK75_05245 [Candidatus Magnetomorum sp.]|nr:hypothetical protein [Candidatus Magnetomorum sp.]
MKVRIENISDFNNLDKECVVLVASEDTNIGGYLIFCVTIDGKHLDNKVKNVFWFPDKKVKAGDYIVLFSKAGADREKQLKKGGKAYHFFWGNDSSVWDNNQKAAVLLHADEWKTQLIHLHSKKS